jgi:hypothetical protein
MVRVKGWRGGNSILEVRDEKDFNGVGLSNVIMFSLCDKQGQGGRRFAVGPRHFLCRKAGF